MNKKGFAMIEVVISVALIFVTSLILYVTVQAVSQNSKQLSKYDSVENIYNLNTIKVFLYNHYDVNVLCDYVYNDNQSGVVLPLISNTNDSAILNLKFVNDESNKMFQKIIEDMKIKTLLFTNYSNVLGDYDIKKCNDVSEDSVYNSTCKLIKEDTNMKKYIDYIDTSITDELVYLLIAEFQDGTFASINMYKVSR